MNFMTRIKSSSKLSTFYANIRVNDANTVTLSLERLVAARMLLPWRVSLVHGVTVHEDVRIAGVVKSQSTLWLCPIEEKFKAWLPCSKPQRVGLSTFFVLLNTCLNRLVMLFLFLKQLDAVSSYTYRTRL